jgi:hypothetical protein
MSGNKIGEKEEKTVNIPIVIFKCGAISVSLQR